MAAINFPETSFDLVPDNEMNKPPFSDDELPGKSQETAFDHVPPFIDEADEQVLSPRRVYISHLAGKGLGFPSGYSSLGVFLGQNSHQGDRNESFVNVIGHVFNNGKKAANAGIGRRYMFTPERKVYGINAFYDYRTSYGHYNQIALGLEMFGCHYDWRVNGYLPVGKKTHFNKHGRRERALPGLDAELASSLKNWRPCHFWNLIGAVGPYYYFWNKGDGARKNIFGGKGRLALVYRDYFSLEMRAYYDPVFKGIFQGVAAVSLPLGKKTSILSKCTSNASEARLRESSLQPVVRNEIIVTKKNMPREE